MSLEEWSQARVKALLPWLEGRVGGGHPPIVNITGEASLMDGGVTYEL